jgi:hypothetical protein
MRAVGLVALVIIGLLLIGAVAREPGMVTPICVDSEMREKVRTLLLAGLEQALRDHTAQTFDTWMKDKNEQPKRAILGMQLAISAYMRSRAAAQNWNPPQCAP